MGRLFWSFDRAMKADCLAIELARDGQGDFLQGLFGPPLPASAPIPAKKPDLPAFTPAALTGMNLKPGLKVVRVKRGG